MASIYDSIKTARELVYHVKNHGLSTNTEDICRAQDIFGHSTIEELDDLANDIGRYDENGNPDPKGTWSSTRIPTRDTFYHILFIIWNYEDATRFWNQHTNPEHDELVVLREEKQELKKAVKDLKSQLDLEHGIRLGETRQKLEIDEKLGKLAAELHDANMTIMELKAKLYDLIAK